MRAEGFFGAGGPAPGGEQVRVYGYPTTDAFGLAFNDTVTPSGHSFAPVPSQFGIQGGNAPWTAVALPDGCVAIGRMSQTNNEGTSTLIRTGIDIFDPDSGISYPVDVPTKTGVFNPPAASGVGSGSTTDDLVVVNVGGTNYIYAVSAVSYHNWAIGLYGEPYFYWCFKQTAPGQWEFDASRSRSTSDLADPASPYYTAAGAAAFPLQINSFGEIYYGNLGPSTLMLMPNSQDIVFGDYFATTAWTTVAAGSDGVDVTTFTGTQTLFLADTSEFQPPNGLGSIITSTGVAQISWGGVAAGQLQNVSRSSGSGILHTGYHCATGSGSAIYNAGSIVAFRPSTGTVVATQQYPNITDNVFSNTLSFSMRAGVSNPASPPGDERLVFTIDTFYQPFGIASPSISYVGPPVGGTYGATAHLTDVNGTEWYTPNGTFGAGGIIWQKGTGTGLHPSQEWSYDSTGLTFTAKSPPVTPFTVAGAGGGPNPQTSSAIAQKGGWGYQNDSGNVSFDEFGNLHNPSHGGPGAFGAFNSEEKHVFMADASGGLPTFELAGTATTAFPSYVKGDYREGGFGRGSGLCEAINWDSARSHMVIVGDDGIVLASTLAPGATTVAAGSSGADVTTFTSGSPGSLDVASITPLPVSGTLLVATSTGWARISYTSLSAGVANGCVTLNGTGTLTTGNTVLVAYGPELCVNGGITNGTNAWGAIVTAAGGPASTLTQVANSSFASGMALQLSSIDGTVNGCNQKPVPLPTSGLGAVGSNFRLKCHVRSPFHTPTVNIELWYYDATSRILVGSDISPDVVTGNMGNDIEVLGSPPEGAVAVTIVLSATASGVSENLWVGDFSLQAVPSIMTNPVDTNRVRVANGAAHEVNLACIVGSTLWYTDMNLITFGPNPSVTVNSTGSTAYIYQTVGYDRNGAKSFLTGGIGVLNGATPPDNTLHFSLGTQYVSVDILRRDPGDAATAHFAVALKATGSSFHDTTASASRTPYTVPTSPPQAGEVKRQWLYGVNLTALVDL